MCVHNSHGQGTIEYLIVIAIVVVLSLVAASYYSAVPGNVQQINAAGTKLNTASHSGITIVDALADTKNNSVLALQNNSGEPIIISSISSDTNENYYNEQLVQGGTKSFLLKNNPSCPCPDDKQTVTCSFLVHYLTMNGLAKTQKITITTDCTRTIKQPDTIKSLDVTPPSISLLSPPNGTASTTGALSFSFNATDNNALANCQLIIDGATAANINSPVQGNITFFQDISSLSTVGVHNWDINCADKSGNLATTIGTAYGGRLFVYSPPASSNLLSLTSPVGGTIDVNSTEISCGSACSGVFIHGTSLQLIANPLFGYKFKQWGGACSGFGTNPVCPLTLDSNKTVSAVFEELPRFTLSIFPVSWQGTIDANTDGISHCGNYNSRGDEVCGISGCGRSDGMCVAVYPVGTPVKLNLAMIYSWNFSSWKGDCSGQWNSTCNLVMDSNKTVYFNFSHNGYD